MTDVIRVDEPAPGVRRLTLDRPERLNALDGTLLDALHEQLDLLRLDVDTRVVILTGAGDAFCAGLDLKDPPAVESVATFGAPQRGMAIQQRIASLIPAIRSLRQPVVAAVNGAATGGGLALALACDVRICASSARFGVAFVRIGLSGCDVGVSYLLPRIIGATDAFELMLTGRVIGADKARELRLVSDVVKDAELQERAVEVAVEICGNSPFGVWMTKEVMWANLEASSLDRAIDLENRNQILASMTADMRRAVDAFMSKDRPSFENR